MWWIKIRFTVNSRGHYADKWVALRSGSAVAAAQVATALCAGYLVGSGYRAVILELDSVSHPGAHQVDAELTKELDELTEHIQKYVEQPEEKNQ
jgi:hypothetical protein